MTGRRIGLALGGGAARGWAHIGVIEALEAAGLAPGIVAGTSIGALVGGAWAAGRLGDLKAWARQVDRRRIAGLLDVNLGTGGLIDGQRIHGILCALGMDAKIEDLPLRYAAVATDLTDGQEVCLRRGALADAIRASIAVPGIISPSHLDGRWLVDGGLANQIPVSVCHAMGAEVVVAVNVGEGLLAKHTAAFRRAEHDPGTARVAEILEQVPAPLHALAERVLPQLIAGTPQTPSYFGTLAACLNIVQGRLTAARLAEEPPDVMISPPVAAISLMEFDRADEAIEAGRLATEAVVGQVRALAEGRFPA
ncbi:patatin-like phospholipase family protein [Pseudogemmobacter sonorensis]|uniref:patatin-like phospholipase family protein n=1 Tax=Pseudogemmobacter sonorensis TaxID=2989681 RepID=UPI003695A0EA